MSKSLEDRLKVAKTELAKVSAILVKHANAGISGDVIAQFNELAAFEKSVEAWLGMLEARQAARDLLTGLEQQVDGSDTVPLGNARVKYQHVRLISVQAYLASKWALADSLAGMVGKILCTSNAAFNVSQPAQLVSDFVKPERKKNTSAALYESIRQTFGWPIAVSYALRNHFVHDGGQHGGVDFFSGPTSASKFEISGDGWNRILEKAGKYDVTAAHHRAGAAWPSTPRDDLRTVLDVCERETDDALGVLVGTACHSIAIHVGYMHGEL